MKFATLSPMAPSGSRITQLDGVRGIAIASVFIYHAYNVKLLWMGVDLFFVLSGFLITGILLKEKSKPFRNYIGDFYTRRALRILPPYLVVLAITAFIFGLGWLRYWYLYIGAMNFVRPLGLPEASTLPLWSLAVEEQFYLMWPLAVYYLSRKQLIRCALVLMALAPILRYVCTPLFSSHWAVFMLLPFRMDTLAVGALVALIWPELKMRLETSPDLQWRIAWGCAAVATVALLIAGVLGRYGFTTNSNTPMGNFAGYEVTLAMMSSLFLVALIGVGKKLFSFWPLLWLGRISYSIYLIHQTAFYLAPKHSVAIAAIGALAYSTAMWFLVEKPILSVGHTRPKVIIPQCDARPVG